MARGVNKVILIGNLGGDPELKYTASGTALATFSIATNESYKDADGNQVERVEWHRVVAWRGLAEVVGQYLKKGKQVYIEGRLQTRSWEDQNGVKKYTTEVVARDLQMLGRKGEGSPTDIPPPADEFPGSTAPSTNDTEAAGNMSEDEDLPF